MKKKYLALCYCGHGDIDDLVLAKEVIEAKNIYDAENIAFGMYMDRGEPSYSTAELLTDELAVEHGIDNQP